MPAFVGYTLKADDNGHSRHMKPTRVTSLSEFKAYFGGEPDQQFTLAKMDAPGASDFMSGSEPWQVTQTSTAYRLYLSMVHFFLNGGGACYIVSVGTYGPNPISKDDLMAGIEPLKGEQEPTMLVIPDCVSLPDGDSCNAVQEQMMLHCGFVMKNRFAILDVFDGYLPRTPSNDPIANFRNSLATTVPSFGAAYYPWLETTVVSDRDITYLRIANKDALHELLTQELGTLPDGATPAQTKRQSDMTTLLGQVSEPPKDDAAAEALHAALVNASPLYKNIMKAVRTKANLLPPSGAMAGLYTQVDNSRGVWKAPANVGVASVVRPMVAITHDEQEDLNSTPQGKSINAIRAFIGEGALVWGARTLDGNSLDWRYLNVRRTMIFLEESCRLAAKAMVLEPNVAGTWLTIKSMIENFLNGIWKRGGLMGAVPEDAYEVHVGLGETMTPDDVLEGILRVTVLVAMVRPAEFIEITFQQLMPKS